MASELLRHSLDIALYKSINESRSLNTKIHPRFQYRKTTDWNSSLSALRPAPCIIFLPLLQLQTAEAAELCIVRGLRASRPSIHSVSTQPVFQDSVSVDAWPTACGRAYNNCLTAGYSCLTFRSFLVIILLEVWRIMWEILTAAERIPSQHSTACLKRYSMVFH